jgi:hypothetical protein
MLVLRKSQRLHKNPKNSLKITVALAQHPVSCTLEDEVKKAKMMDECKDFNLVTPLNTLLAWRLQESCRRPRTTWDSNPEPQDDDC